MNDPRIPFSNSYARLPEHFHSRVEATPVADPRLLLLNRPLAAELGIDLDGVEPEALAAIFSGNRLPTGAEPISMVYAGHQFGGYSPQLGDGRAILLGEVIDRQGRRRDIQLKGAGRTPYSRRGDGRAALGPVMREYVVSEAMQALGIPTTRALAAVATGEPVYREQRLPGAVLTRVAASHIRVGTFQFFAAHGDTGALRELTGHVLARHYPEAVQAPRPALALLNAFAGRHAGLVARWMSVGFIHGVMNTDNMAVSGETIDYGPCAFLEAYDPAAVFSAIDEQGRYAYANQPWAAQWNLARFAQALLPLIDADAAQAAALAQEVVDAFPARFESEWLAVMRAKIGLSTAQPGDADLVAGLLETMHANQADFTLSFRRLAHSAGVAGPAGSPEGAGRAARELFAEPAAFDAWAAQWHQRLALENNPPPERSKAMQSVNPALIPRNHRVEQALQAAIADGDLGPTIALLDALGDPYREPLPEHAKYARPAQTEERVLRTYCGT
jgi:uncharacterized protein YdiU (UPF0061 family)